MSANVERLIVLRDLLHANPERHNQGHWVPHSNRVTTVAERLEGCGITACAAGWTLWAFDPDALIRNYSVVSPEDDRIYKDSIPKSAAKLLGLSAEQADVLFFSTCESAALIVLDYLIAHPDATCDELAVAGQVELHKVHGAVDRAAFAGAS